MRCRVTTSCPAQVLVKDLRFQQKPFEWNYEGLAPLLLRDVLRTRRGISLSLAMLCSGVARRMGLSLLPLPVSLAGGRTPHACVHAPGLQQLSP